MTTNNCPFCHHRLRAGETIVRCPGCRREYHQACWQANGSRCAVLGCSGSGSGILVVAPEVAAEKIKIDTMDLTTTERVECPHCHGVTVCIVEENGSCLRCLTQNNVTNLERVVICSVCNGSGEAELSVERANCRHCEGATYCFHGIRDDISCQSCINFGTQGRTIRDRAGKTVMESFAEATMCSVCKGQGAMAVPSRNKRGGYNKDRHDRNRW